MNFKQVLNIHFCIKTVFIDLIYYLYYLVFNVMFLFVENKN